MLPVFLDEKITRLINRHMIRAHLNPELWHPVLLPMKKLYYIYGQASLKIEEGVIRHLQHLKVDFEEITVTRDSRKLEYDLSREFDSPIPFLIIRNGHMLRHHRELFLKTLYLKDVAGYIFILVIGSEIPDADHPFFDQFEEKMVSSLPSRQFCEDLLRFYFLNWKDHWKHSKVILNDEDFMFLTISCDYCTSGDIETFAHCIFRYVLDEYPEKKVDIDLDLCKQFMHPLNSQIGVFCITDRDGRREQGRYDPESIGDAAPVQKPERKRTRTETFID